MQKEENIFSMIKLGLVLVCYAVGCCFVLALVNLATKPQIALNSQHKAELAMKKVFQSASSFEKVDQVLRESSVKSIKITDVSYAKDGSKICGAVCKVTGPTYDKATLIMGLDTEGKITGVEFLEITDSPGFGSKAKDPTYKVSSGTTFYDQFAGFEVSRGFLLGKDATFDAITGATITSRGVASLLKEGSDVLVKQLEGIER